MTRIQGIRTRLAAATPGPWRTGWLQSYNAVTGEPQSFVYRVEEETPDSRIRIGTTDGVDCDADAELIANAPADLAYLLARVEELEAENAALRAELESHGG